MNWNRKTGLGSMLRNRRMLLMMWHLLLLLLQHEKLRIIFNSMRSPQNQIPFTIWCCCWEIIRFFGLLSKRTLLIGCGSCAWFGTSCWWRSCICCELDLEPLCTFIPCWLTKWCPEIVIDIEYLPHLSLWIKWSIHSFVKVFNEKKKRKKKIYLLASVWTPSFSLITFFHTETKFTRNFYLKLIFVSFFLYIPFLELESFEYAPSTWLDL